MRRLKFYELEEAKFPLQYSIFLNKVQTRRLVRKLTKHYKFTIDRIKFYGNLQNGLSYYNHKVIKLPKSPSVGLTIHELAHQFQQQKDPTGRLRSKHDKELMKIISKFTEYAKKKEYWLK